MHIYRKIWLDHFGPIPKDYRGRSFEIHHLDGDRQNNDINNLRCVSLEEHYWIHWFQGDWKACSILSIRLKLAIAEISALQSLANKKRIEEGTHIFCDKKFRHDTQMKRVADGTHNFLGGKIQSEHNQRRVEDGTHHLLKENRDMENYVSPFCDPEISRKITKERIANGTHTTQQIHTCPHCGKIGKSFNMFRWHFDRCRQKS